MKFFKIKKSFKLFTDLKFAILILIIIAISSSLGSIIEQDESLLFYQQKYSKPIYGFINANFITNLGINHVYNVWWFLLLLAILGICLISCTITRQFPLFLASKEIIFKQKNKSFACLPFFAHFLNIFYAQEFVLVKFKKLNFNVYQNQRFTYGYKGLIGRISPILVHLSLILILIGACIGSINNFKAQEILPKGEFFNIQNPISVGRLTFLPHINVRVNDFWVQYKRDKINQFYSNISILDNYGAESIVKTISVNNPLRSNGIDFYQSDWNLLGLRAYNKNENKINEFPFFSLKENSKSWITWITISEKNYSLVFDQFQNTFLLYNQEGGFLGSRCTGDIIGNNYTIIDIIASTGLLIKYDPTIFIIYLGFGLLMVTTLLSFLPYTQIWLLNGAKYSWLGGNTNRGKTQLEIEFENIVHIIEKI